LSYKFQLDRENSLFWLDGSYHVVQTWKSINRGSDPGYGGRIAFYGRCRSKINQSKFYLKSVHFITVQHKLSRAFQTDMHNKIT
jgi:hypothetical protein